MNVFKINIIDPRDRYIVSSLFTFVLLICKVFSTNLAFAQSEGTKLLDNYFVSTDLFTSAEEKGMSSFYELDYFDKVNGDFSIRIDISNTTTPEEISFKTNLWNLPFPLDEKSTFKMSVKVQTDKVEREPVQWQLKFRDGEGDMISSQVDVSLNGTWQEVVLPFSQVNDETTFNYGSIQECVITGEGIATSKVVNVDFIRFETSNGEVFGVTDKPIEQWITERDASKELRLLEAMNRLASTIVEEESNEQFKALRAFAKLYLNKDLAQANKILREFAEKSTVTEWGLFKTAFLNRTYLLFSKSQGKYPGRLEPETEKLILHALWEKTKYKNDIHWARESTWLLDGSENHDLHNKGNNLVTSFILMNEPEYKDRPLPDLGHGGGYYYGMAGYYGKDVDPSPRMSGGRAELADGKEFVEEEHYNAWVSYFKTYFKERAKHGWFVEHHSPVYSKHTINIIELIMTYGGDEELSKLVNDFMTLYFANWTQTSIGATTGGTKTRHSKLTGYPNSNIGMMTRLMGGAYKNGIFDYWLTLSDFELPEVVMHMALDREGMGYFEYAARGIGEEVPKYPRKLGAERSLHINPNSRYMRYAYVSPSYVLGTQMDHPLALHSHLSIQNRFHGMNFTEDNQRFIRPVIQPRDTDGEISEIPSTMGFYRTLQHKNTLIVQQSSNYLVLHPDWFPHKDINVGHQAIWVGKDWDQKVEKDGWVFLRQGDVYAGILPIMRISKDELEQNVGIWPNKKGAERIKTVPRKKDGNYSWHSSGNMILLPEHNIPVMIQAGDKKQYESFESFMRVLLDMPLDIYKTVVAGYNEIVLTPPGDEVELSLVSANGQNFFIDGKAPEYDYPMTVNSPFIKSKYGSGEYEISYGGETLKLKF